MFRDVPECSGMFHVPAFIDDHFRARKYFCVWIKSREIVSLVHTTWLNIMFFVHLLAGLHFKTDGQHSC